VAQDEANTLNVLNFRLIEATDALGGTEHLEYHFETPSLSATAPAAEVPAGFEEWNTNLDHWNAFYWDKRAWALGQGDLTKATITHWLVNRTARSRTSGECLLGRPMGSILSRNEPSDKPGTIQENRHQIWRWFENPVLQEAERAGIVAQSTSATVVCQFQFRRISQQARARIAKTDRPIKNQPNGKMWMWRRLNVTRRSSDLGFDGGA
jgi:hypothetical protein